MIFRPRAAFFRSRRDRARDTRRPVDDSPALTMTLARKYRATLVGRRLWPPTVVGDLGADDAASAAAMAMKAA